MTFGNRTLSLLVLRVAFAGLLGACSGAGDGEIGAACDDKRECGGGTCFHETRYGKATGWSGGYCSQPCDGASCPEGASCVALGGAAWCAATCDGAEACRDGYVCSNTGGVCLPDCRSGWECGDGYRCADDGQCEADPGVLTDLGGPCDHHADCRSGVCFRHDDGWTGGTCARPCTAAGGCPTDATCTALDGEPWCLHGCTDDSSCRDGYLCSVDTSACLPDCRQGWACGDGYVCEEGRCAVDTSGLSPLGDGCDGPSDCETGVCFSADDGWPGGTCADTCAGPWCDGACVSVGGEAWCVGSCAGTCRAGYLCDPAAQACLPDCRLGWECGDGYHCGDDGRCTPGDPGHGYIGTTCEHAGDCLTGVCFSAEDSWPGGYCAGPCGGVQCDDQTACVALDQTPWCLKRCADASGCRAGYVCHGDLEVCLPDCRNGWECGDGWVCGAEGQCEAAPVELAALGESCAKAAECQSAVCFDDAEGWPDGLCADVCANCGDGGECVPLSGQPWCLPSCTATSCRPGYLCNSDLLVCLPDCRLGWNCGEGFTCGTDGECEAEIPAITPYGLPCGVDADCGGDGLTCMMVNVGPGAPPGLCSSDCTTDPCPEGAQCTAWEGGHWCFRECVASGMNGGCFPPSTCTTTGVCYPP